MKKGDIVTVELEENNKASNTYIIGDLLGEEAFLSHPLNPKVFIKKPVRELNTVAANLKDSTERAIEFALQNCEYLDYNTKAYLDSLIMVFVVNRKLSNKQKKDLSDICGYIASIQFDNDVDIAIRYINENQGVMDSFNQMWYSNFRLIFQGKRSITRPNQRKAIFNIAGHVMAELMRNEASKKD